MKTSDGFEWTEIHPGYWKDEATGLVWGPVIGKFNFDDARAASHKEDALGLVWTVPTLKEWFMAEIHDVREVLSDMEHLFWSSSPRPSLPDLAYVFYGGYGLTGYGLRLSTLSVRCVGR